MKYFVIFLVLIATGVVATNPVYALSCGVPQFMESYDRHDLLLHGKLVEKELLFPESENQKTTNLTFDTIKMYKGEFNETFTIKANLSWDDYYREDANYVLFADKDGDGYLRELCVADYVSSPSIIKFLDEFLQDSTIGDDVFSLYDVVQGFERDDLDIRINKYSSLNREGTPVPEPDEKQIPNGNLSCGKGATLQDGICLVDNTEDKQDKDPSNRWGGTAGPHEFDSPLKQIKNGVALIDVKCNEGKILVHKYNRMRAACVYPETEGELIFKRGWAVMRLGSPATDNLPRDLCDSYQGKWIAEYKECILLETPLQCSLMGGVYNECASACRNDPDFPNVICTDNCVEVCSIESSTLEDIKNNPVVEAFYAKYDNSWESVRSDHVSYSAGNEDDFLVRMNLYFDESYDLTHMEFYCFVEGKLQHEVAQEDILNYLQNFHCMTLSDENRK